MKKKNIIIISIVLVVIIVIVSLAAVNFGSKNKYDYEDKFRSLSKKYEDISYDEDSKTCFVNNKILIYTEKDNTVGIDGIASSVNARYEEINDRARLYVLLFDQYYSYEDYMKIIDTLNNSEGVERAFIDRAGMFSGMLDAVPSDPWGGSDWDTDCPAGYNWHLETVDAPTAWEYSEYFEPVKIGIIEAWNSSLHEDIEINDCFGVETELDYQTKGLNYFGDWIKNHKKIQENKSNVSHGMMVSGVVGATWNDIGISGIVGNAGEIYMAGRAEDDEISTDTADYWLYEVYELLEADVKVMNYSRGFGDGFDEISYAASRGNRDIIDALEIIINDYEQGLVNYIDNVKGTDKENFIICTSAGNNNAKEFCISRNSDYGYKKATVYDLIYEQKGIDAKYNSLFNLIDNEEIKKHIIVVGAVERKEKNKIVSYDVCDFSNGGSRVDVLAPGKDIYSLSLDNGYEKASGTSFSAPIVSAEAALLFSINPELTSDEVKKIIINTSTGRYKTGDSYRGIVNIGDAVEYAVNKYIEGPNEGLTTKNDDGDDTLEEQEQKIEEKPRIKTIKEINENGTYSITEYEYDENKRLLSTEKKFFSADGNPDMRVVSKTSYKYDEAGNQIEEIHSTNGEVRTRILNEYDDRGNTIKTTAYSGKGNNETIYSESDYEYDDKNNRIYAHSYCAEASDRYTPDDYDGEKRHVYSYYEYDGQGRMIKMRTEDPAFGYDYEYNYIYDEEKLDNGLTRITVKEGNWIDEEYDFIYSMTDYDDNGNTIVSYDVHQLDGYVIEGCYNEYSYNEYNDVIRRVYSSAYYGDEPELYITDIEYEYYDD